MTSEIKIIIIATAGVAALMGTYAVSDYFSKKREMLERQADKQRDADTQLKKAEIESTYPPEYWVAKKAEIEADEAVRKAQIESEERLKIDQRDRDDQRRKETIEFEKDAPESYWQHKKFKEEEETKRKQMEIDDNRRKRLEEQERELARKNAKAFEEGIKTLERGIRTANYASTMWS